MIKVSSNKMGNVYIEEDLIKSVMKSIIVDFVPAKNLINIDLDIKRSNLKFINVRLDKTTQISREDQRNLIDSLSFTLSNKYQLNNKVITFTYEK